MVEIWWKKNNYNFEKKKEKKNRHFLYQKEKLLQKLVFQIDVQQHPISLPFHLKI